MSDDGKAPEVSDEGKRRQAEAGAANLARWKAEHPGESNRTHGARSRHVRKRYLDGRTREGKQMRGVIRDLVEDLGGMRSLSAGQRLLIDRVREMLIVLSSIGAYIDKQPGGVVSPAGELLPVLRHGYATHAENLRRAVSELYSLASKRPARTPSLEEYLRARKAEKDREEKARSASGNGPEPRKIALEGAEDPEVEPEVGNGDGQDREAKDTKATDSGGNS